MQLLVKKWLPCGTQQHALNRAVLVMWWIVCTIYGYLKQFFFIYLFSLCQSHLIFLTPAWHTQHTRRKGVYPTNTACRWLQQYGLQSQRALAQHLEQNGVSEVDLIPYEYQLSGQALSVCTANYCRADPQDVCLKSEWSLSIKNALVTLGSTW